MRNVSVTATCGVCGGPAAGRAGPALVLGRVQTGGVPDQAGRARARPSRPRPTRSMSAPTARPATSAHSAARTATGGAGVWGRAGRARTAMSWSCWATFCARTSWRRHRHDVQPNTQQRRGHDDRSHLRPGVGGTPEGGADDRLPDRRVPEPQPSPGGSRSPTGGSSPTRATPAPRLVRPALERLRDLAAQVPVDVVVCYSPDRLARKLAYQTLLIDEFNKAGTEVRFVKARKVETPEDEMLLQFQGMMAEYERALIIGTNQTWQGFSGSGRRRQRARRRPLRLPLHPPHRRLRGPLRDRRRRSPSRARDLPPLHRGPGVDRRAGPLADRREDPDPHRQGPLGPLGHLGRC